MVFPPLQALGLKSDDAFAAEMVALQEPSSARVLFLPPPSLQALGLRPEDAFTAEMLAEAMEESSAAFQATLEQM